MDARSLPRRLPPAPPASSIAAAPNARAGASRFGRSPSPIAWITLDRIVQQAGWLGFFIVLAPILGPRDYGLFVIAMSGIAVVETLLSEVAAQALIALDIVDDTHLSTAFVTNTAAGAIVSLLLYAVAGIVAATFDDAALGDIFHSLSLLPLLSALTAVPIALLQRQRCFVPLVASSLLGICAGGSVAVALAAVGGGAWSLVAQIITQRFIEITILWGGAGRLIGLRWSRRHFGELAGATTAIVLTPALSSIARQMPRFLVGLTLGPTAAGLYTLADRLLDTLVDIFLAPIAAAARIMPATGRRDRRRATRRIGGVMLRASLAAFPAILGSAAFLGIAMPAIFDLRWWGAVLPAQILILAAVPLAVQTGRTTLLLAAGRPAAETGCQAVQTATGAIAVLIAAPYGLVAVSAALVIHAAIVAAAGLWLMRRTLGRAVGAVLAATAKPFAAAAVAGGALLALQSVLSPSLPLLLAVPLLGGCGALAYGLMLALPLRLALLLPLPEA